MNYMYFCLINHRNVLKKAAVKNLMILENINAILDILKTLRFFGLIANISWLVAATVLAYQIYDFVSFDPEDGPYYCNKRCFEILFLKTIGMWVTICIIFLVFCGLVIYGSIKRHNEDIPFDVTTPI